MKDFIQQKEVSGLQIYYNQPDVIDVLTYAEFFKKYNASSELPKYYYNNRNAKNNVSLDRHYFKVRMDPDQKIQYVYVPVRKVKRCICIKMLYVTSGDIYYLRLILLNRKAHSDKDVLTYTPVCGGGKPIVCTSYHVISWPISVIVNDA